MARFLGIDIGQRRIGISLSDPSGTIASPYQTLLCKSPEADRKALIALGEAEEVAGYVVGLPLCLDGSQGIMARKAKVFSERLAKESGRPVYLWDERLSTAAAERALLEAGSRRDTRRERRDAVAAALILQGWLDSRPREAEGEESTER